MVYVLTAYTQGRFFIKPDPEQAKAWKEQILASKAPDAIHEMVRYLGARRLLEEGKIKTMHDTSMALFQQAHESENPKATLWLALHKLAVCGSLYQPPSCDPKEGVRLLESASRQDAFPEVKQVANLNRAVCAPHGYGMVADPQLSRSLVQPYCSSGDERVAAFGNDSERHNRV